MEEMALVFTPENEPYLGNEALLVLDQTIPVALSSWKDFERLRDEQNEFSPVLLSLGPQILSITLGLREQIRQAYIFAASVLARPLMERSITLDYLARDRAAIAEWTNGWRYRQRPSLAKMLEKLDDGRVLDGENPLKKYNDYVHASPAVASVLLKDIEEHGPKAEISKQYEEHQVCSELSMLGAFSLSIILAHAAQCTRKG